MANSESAKARGDCADLEKSMAEKVELPEVTSGTLERVFAVAEQVMEDWIELTTSATSPGRGVLPTTKQALAWRRVRSVVGRAVVVESRLRRVSADVVEARMLCGLWVYYYK